MVLIMLFLHSVHNEFRFIVFIHGRIPLQVSTTPLLGPQFLGRAVRVIFNHRISCIKNGLRGTIVLLQLDNPGLGIIRFEIHNISKIRTAPGVNTLVCIAYSADILKASGNVFRHQVLRVVRILVFVDKDIMETILPAPADGFISQKRSGNEEKIVEIKGIVLLHMFVIEIIHIRCLLVIEISSCLTAESLGAEKLVFSRRNTALDGPGLKLLIIQIQFLQYILHQLFGIIRIVNGEFIGIGWIIVDFPAEETGAEGMEGIHPDFICCRPDQTVNTIPHFLGCFIGKSNGQDFTGADAQRKHVGNPAGQSLRFTGTGAGHNQYRTLHLFNCFQLAVI